MGEGGKRQEGGAAVRSLFAPIIQSEEEFVGLVFFLSFSLFLFFSFPLWKLSPRVDVVPLPSRLVVTGVLVVVLKH